MFFIKFFLKNVLNARKCLVAIIGFLLGANGFAQGSAFSYQGRLNHNGTPVTGIYDLRFELYDASTSGALIAGPTTNSTVAVTNGLFTAKIDFGVNAFTGPDRWLEIGARTNGAASFNILSARQPVLAAPYAITAGNLTGNLSAGQVSGTLNSLQIPNLDASKITTGTFTGNASGLTNLNAANLIGTLSDSHLSTNVPLVRIPGRIGPYLLSQSPAVGTQPLAVISADVNGDGYPDLISVNNLSQNISILTNNGAGFFPQTQTLDFGLVSPVSGAAADFNGDGYVDLVIANSGANTLTVLTNNGAGVFTAMDPLPVDPAPSSVIAADVNGDGYPDLISANFSFNSLSVLTNDRHGQFSASQSVSVGANPVCVTAADLNADGHIDLISANSDKTLTIATNDGTGLFPSPQTQVLEFDPLFVITADVNNDGWVDLISANGLTNTLTVLTNDGAGLFPSAYFLTVGSHPLGVTTADVNNDGRVDLISADSSGNSLTVLTNNGSGAFTLARSVSVGSLPQSVAALDLNGDGLVDLVSANNGNGKLSVVFGSGVSTVPLYDANQTFSGANAFTNSNNIFAGDGSELKGLNATQITSGTVADARLSLNVPLLDANQTFGGANNFANSGNVFAGDGGGLFGLDASQLSTGIMPDARLSANVPLLSADQTFLGATEFANAGNSFKGNGGRLTGLDASQLTGGTVPLERLSGAVVTNLEAGVTLSGTFSGNGAGLTNTPTANNYIYAYRTTSQTVSFANLFQNITFTLNGQINGWGHTAGSASFTNTQAGVYLVTYAAEVGIIVGTPQTAVFKANQNGVEIVGSQWSTVASDDLPVFGSKSFIVNLNSLDVLTFQFGGTSTTVQLIGSTVMGTIIPSASVTIVRIQ